MQIETTIEIAIGIKHKGRNLKHRTNWITGEEIQCKNRQNYEIRTNFYQKIEIFTRKSGGKFKNLNEKHGGPPVKILIF